MCLFTVEETGLEDMAIVLYVVKLRMNLSQAESIMFSSRD